LKTIVLIVGESCSGKDFLSQILEEKDEYRILKSYTTRPKRVGEVNTHIFIKPEEVKNYKDDFVAYTKIGEYEYFSTKQQLLDSDIYIIDPNGVEFLKSKVNDIDFKPVVIYINVSEEERLNRAKNIRKDSEYEIAKRFKAEREQFDRFKLNADFDYSVSNRNIMKAYEIIKYIIEIETGGLDE
jgi:guanylate kinase